MGGIVVHAAHESPHPAYEHHRVERFRQVVVAAQREAGAHVDVVAFGREQHDGHG